MCKYAKIARASYYKWLNRPETLRDRENAIVLDEIIKVYGNKYYKRMSDIGVSVIGYVDKDRKINLEFYNYENTVVMIRYDINSMQ